MDNLNVQPKPWVNPLEKSNFRPYKMKLLSPIYTAENFWHGSDEKSTRTKKIGSARIDLVV